MVSSITPKEIRLHFRFSRELGTLILTLSNADPRATTGLHIAQYRIDAELGRGGMGIVYRATDTNLDRTVALKLLPGSALACAEDRARFYREAKAAAQLNHPNIAAVYQIDEAVPHRDGQERPDGAEARPFIAMEYVDGETLAARIARGPLRLTDVVSIATQVAEALKAAHGKEIVHRDVKPANVMLTADGVAKVLDFGLARTQASTMLTRVGSTLGTVAYMSPEQLRGQEVDGRSDLYSLGTLLFELVTGRLPFGQDYEQAIQYAILNEPPEPLTALRTGVPMELERLVHKLLTKEADYRYQTAADLIADLRSLDVTGSGHTRRAATLAAAAAPATRTVLPKWVWGGMAGALVLGAALVWFLKPGAEPIPTTRFRVELEAAVAPLDAAWSPDGRTLYYVAMDSASGNPIVRRYDLATGISTPVAGTEHAGLISLSPDGRWLLFGNTQNHSVYRVLASGGQTSAIPHSTNIDSPHAVAAPNGDLYFPFDDYDMGRLTEEGRFEPVALNDTLPGRYFAAPVVAPSGGQIYFVAYSGIGRTDGTWAILEPGGKPVHAVRDYDVFTITTNGYAVVAPVGRAISHSW